MLGILAFGSLIDEPGKEIEAATADRQKMRTPFYVEFARSSSTRGGAPTLVPVDKGGATVDATLLVLNDTISEREAMNILWRRETRKDIGSREEYQSRSNPGPNRVLVRAVQLAEGKALYTDFPDAGKITNPTAKLLADLAVSSAKNDHVPTEHNGISYLIAARKAGIMTPLLPEFEKEVLRIIEAETLEAALVKVQTDG
jgi:hypothetical protein